MITFSIIRKSQLEGAQRLDAEYYQPEYLSRMQKLTISPTVELQEIAYITDGEHGSPIWDESSGIKYFSAQHVKDCLIDESGANTISSIIDERNKRSRLQEGDILLSTVGTIGFAGLVTDNLLPANIDRHVARIALNENTLDPEFLVAVLNSSYGRFQSIRESTGNVQLNLFIDKIKKIRVPKNNNSAIAQLVKLALQELSSSEKLYQQSEDLLLEELGLKDFIVEDDLNFVMNLSDVQSANRVDADYFQPKYKNLESRIKNAEFRQLGELVSMKKGFEPGSEAYQEEGKPFIRVSSLSRFGIEEKDQKYLKDELYEKLKNDFKPQVEEILLTKDATPGIAYVLKESIEAIISGGILRLKVKNDLDPEYLTLCINSIVGKMQVERDAGGSIIAHWKPEQIRNLLIEVPVSI
ncbi:MAG: restriction endonuclease subunit S [Candidatus Levybacteria bacterium]|nr:restriction endonuclease subunit S [Candidatus Levybacteria bacterium]